MALARKSPARSGLRGSSYVGDTLFRALTLLFAVGVLVAAALLVFTLAKQAWPALSNWSVATSVLTSTTWNLNNNQFGGLVFIFGTVVTSVIALLLAGIVGVMVAVFLVELAPSAFGRPVSFLVEMLAAVPSIIFGFWAILVLIPYVLGPLEIWLNTNLGFIPLFGGTQSQGNNILTAGIVLSIMILPTIAAISRDVMAAVPGSQREGMLALGATRWEVVRRVVIPYARSGIIGALILGLGRAVGETMAVTMVIGNGFRIQASLLQTGQTITALLFNDASEVTDPLHRGVIFELGLLLFVISIGLNALARLLVWQVNRGRFATAARR